MMRAPPATAFEKVAALEVMVQAAVVYGLGPWSKYEMTELDPSALELHAMTMAVEAVAIAAEIATREAIEVKMEVKAAVVL